MPMPQRVRDEAAQAEQQMEQLRQQQFGTQQPTPPSNDQPPVEPTPADSQFGVHQEVQPINGDPTPGNESGPITAEQFAQLQQQMSTLQGNFGQQNARLQAAMERNNVLEQALSRALDRSNERPVAPTTPAPAPSPVSVTQAEIDEYGADLTEFIRKLVKDGVGAAVQPLLDQLQGMNTSLTQTSHIAQATQQTAAQQAWDRYVSQMDALVVDADGKPDWMYINNMHERGDNRFVDWLNKTGEDSDEPRLNVIQRAFAQRAADRCARMINNFKREVGMADGTQSPVATTPSTTASSAAALVSPSTQGSGSGAPRGRPPAKIYTQADVEKHYDEKVKKKWVGREAEWKRIADDMDRAVLDQRYQVEGTANRRGR